MWEETVNHVGGKLNNGFKAWFRCRGEIEPVETRNEEIPITNSHYFFDRGLTTYC